MLKKFLAICIALTTLQQTRCNKTISRESNNNKKIMLVETYQQNLSLTDFEKKIFSFQKALTSSDILILLVPENLNDTTPISKHAPHIEKSRILLTWISIYNRANFKGADVRVVRIPEDAAYTTRQINSAIQNAAIKKTTSSPTFFGLGELLDEPLQNPENLKDIYIKKFETIAEHPTKPKKLLVNLEKFHSKKRLLVTGGAGFIGSHLVKKFLDIGYQVIALDNLSCSKAENLKDFLGNPNFCFIKFDVTKPFEIEGPIDGILHLASVPSPEMYYKMPIETIRTGLHGTKNCLQLAKKKGSRFLLASTSEVYGDAAINPQPENYPGNVNMIGPRAQYDESKRGGETLTMLYANEFQLDVRIARIFNTYGPKMQLGDGRVVTNFIRASLENKPMMLYGGGKQTRSFAYVDDTVDGIVKLFETEKITTDTPIEERVFNIGSPMEFTIADLAYKVNELSKKYLRRATPIQEVDQFDITDPKLRCPEISRAQSILGYQPTITLQEGLEKTFQYFLEKNYR